MKNSKKEATRELRIPEQLSQFSTEDLINELSSRQGARQFNAGIYANYDVSITRKYSNDRTPVELPKKSTVLIIEKL